MRIVKLSVLNYKSLRGVSIAPGDLNVIVGPNDSGKSNFADCIDFLTDVYKDGLILAVARKGGYDNIVHRRRSRSTAPIKLHVAIELSGSEVPTGVKQRNKWTFRFEHEFEFRTHGRGIREEYFVSRESFIVTAVGARSSHRLISVTRDPDGLRSEQLSVPADFRKGLGYFSTIFELIADSAHGAGSDLFVSWRSGGLLQFVDTFLDNMSQVRVFQFSATNTRQAASPSPNPQLERYGENLPTIVDYLQRQHPEAWGQIFTAMRRIVPSIDKIEVDYTNAKLLGLFFRERGIRRPWTSSEVSDGTIQTLALLTAIYDPQSRFLLLEEPENSVHPWIIRNIVDACREVVSRKQILLTTHSPILIDSVTPEELWLIWRDSGGSHIERLLDVEPDLSMAWNSGTSTISEYLDSGMSPAYVPAGIRSPAESGVDEEAGDLDEEEL